jgi:hypothetical protein
MIYSLRQVPKWPANEWPRFPFDEWNDCMRQAERAVAESPQARIENTGAELLPPLSEHIELRYQVTDSEAAYSTLPVLCRTLFQAGLGVCYLTGGWYPDNPNANHECEIECYGELPAVGDEYAIDCYGELSEIVPVIRRVVEEAGRPGVRLYQRMPRGTCPPYRRIAL